MRHRSHRYRLGRVTEHRWATIRNLLVALFRHERITTTLARAKAIRPWADRMITLAKRENLHARRQVLAMVPDTEVVGRLFDTVAARFADRRGGYTRIIPDGVRRGDAAPLVILELTERAERPKEPDKGKRAKKEKPPKAAAAAGRKKKAKVATASA